MLVWLAGRAWPLPAEAMTDDAKPCLGILKRKCLAGGIERRADRGDVLLSATVKIAPPALVDVPRKFEPFNGDERKGAVFQAVEGVGSFEPERAEAFHFWNIDELYLHLLNLHATRIYSAQR